MIARFAVRWLLGDRLNDGDGGSVEIVGFMNGVGSSRGVLTVVHKERRLILSTESIVSTKPHHLTSSSRTRLLSPISAQLLSTNTSIRIHLRR